MTRALLFVAATLAAAILLAGCASPAPPVDEAGAPAPGAAGAWSWEGSLGGSMDYGVGGVAVTVKLARCTDIVVPVPERATTLEALLTAKPVDAGRGGAGLV